MQIWRAPTIGNQNCARACCLLLKSPMLPYVSAARMFQPYHGKRKYRTQGHGLGTSWNHKLNDVFLPKGKEKPEGQGWEVSDREETGSSEVGTLSRSRLFAAKLVLPINSLHRVLICWLW